MVDTKVLDEKYAKLTDTIRQYGSVIVAYSGGVDSSLLAWFARNTLQENAKIVIAVSPSLAQDELAFARLQAEQFRWDLIEIQTSEVTNPEYQKNDLMRCYVCKKTLFEELHQMAEEQHIACVAYGANVDDFKDFRPGHKAARELQVVSPLCDAGLTKEEIRLLAKQVGLPSWDRPQAACLSSRFPTLETVTIEKLSQVEKAESLLRRLGFVQLRVRHHGDLARIELGQNELCRLGSDPALMQDISKQVKLLGYRYVSLDMDGYQRGSGNRIDAQQRVLMDG